MPRKVRSGLREFFLQMPWASSATSMNSARLSSLERYITRDLFPMVSLCRLAINDAVGPAVDTTEDFTVAGEYQYFAIDATAGDVTVTLPTADEWELPLYFKKTNSSGGNVVITPDGSDTIDGAATLTISTQYESVHLVSNRENSWWKF